MVKVICIGMYNSEGKFISSNWYEALNWLKVNCDSLIIYCHIEYEKIYKLFNQTCDINIMETPDKEMNIQAYKLYNFKKNFWTVIKEIDFYIDSEEEISHLFFMFKEQLLCMLEVTDYENYMMIYYINDNNIKYSSIISNSEDNKNICNTHKEDIDGLADGEEWLPY